jgi:hypothetical protein
MMTQELEAIYSKYTVPVITFLSIHKQYENFTSELARKLSLNPVTEVKT